MNRVQAAAWRWAPLLFTLSWTLLTLPTDARAAALRSQGGDGGEAQRRVTRLLELHGKIRPGMGLDAIKALLGPPAETGTVGSGVAARYVWLHGEVGIEVYEREKTAYQVSITLPCGSAAGADRLMGELTGRGRQKYGSSPLYERAQSYYYWEGEGVRFAFSKYSKTTVKSFCRAARERAP